MKNTSITARIAQIFLFTQKARFVETNARNYSALSFRLSGESHFLAKGEEKVIGAGAVLLVPAGVSYARDCTEDEEIIVFHFDSPETIGGDILDYCGENTEEYRHLFERALAIWERKDTGYHYAVTSIFYEILAKLSRDTATKSPEAITIAERGALSMQKAFASPALTIEALAKELYISPVYLRRTFHAHFDVSPKQYLLALRIEHAKELLSSGYYTQAEIAKRCGFEDVGYFRTAFKHHTGKTPKEYARVP